MTTERSKKVLERRAKRSTEQILVDLQKRRIRHGNQINKDGWIYFLLVEELQHLKIGFSINDPESVGGRWRSLQIGNSLELKFLGKVPATKWDETRFHVVFREFSIRGEWYRYEGLLKDKVEIWLYAFNMIL